MKYFMKEKYNIIYNKIWRRNQKQVDQENEKISEVMLLGFVKVQGHHESTIEGVKVQDEPDA